MKVIEKEAVYKMLHNLGGCDAKEAWAKGYDAAIDDAISNLDDIPVIEVEMEDKNA